MPPNPERQQRMRARREQMANDPELNAAAERAGQAVLGGQMAAPEDWPGSTTVGPRQPDAPASALPPRQAPATAGELMGKPTVPGEPILRGRTAGAGMRGGGGMPQRGPAPPAGAPPTMAPRQVNPLQLSPGSPFKYAKGGKVANFGFASGGGGSYGKDYRKEK